jgi:hypothetical protein
MMRQAVAGLSIEMSTYEESIVGTVVDPEFNLLLTIGNNEIRVAVIGEVDKSIPMLIGESDSRVVDCTGEQLRPRNRLAG